MRLRTPRARPSLFLFLALSATLWAQRPGSSALGRLAPPPPAKQAASGKKANSTAKPPVPIFKDIAQQAGLTVSHLSSNEKRYVIESMSGGVGLFDCDRDGNVDLFVSRYVHVDMDHLPVFGSSKFCNFKGVPVQCGPWGMQGESDLLFHNKGDVTFEEVSKKAGVSDPNQYYGLGVIWGDYDNDGWPDLFVADDATPNYLYHNNHDDVGMLTGIALSGAGQAQGSMGVTWGDYDHDGRLDMFITEFADQPNTLYHYLGGSVFEDASLRSQLGQRSMNRKSTRLNSSLVA